MSTSSFQSGATFDVERKQYVLVRMVDSDTWQAEEARTRRIREFQAAELRHLYSSGQLVFSAPAAKPASAQSALVPAAGSALWEGAKVRRAYVMAIVDVPGTRAVIKPILAGVWEKLGRPGKAPPDASTALRWKARFVASRRNILSLVEQHCSKGNKEPRFDQETIDLVSDAIDKVYMKRTRGTVQDTLDEAIVLVARENELRTEQMQIKLPTQRLVRRLINQIPAYDRYVARYGRAAADNKFRTVLGHRRTDAPLARAEMDHSPLDLMAIDDQTNLPLGRPYLTICIDDYSRALLGIYISFVPPSYFTVARCLRHALLPKTDLRDLYPSIRNEWPAYGVMSDLIVDQAREFHDHSLEAACLVLGITIHYAPRKQAWFKGKVERVIGTTNRGIAHKAPGTTFANIVEKGDYDPAKHAVVRYSVLKEVVHKWICDVYMQKPHRTLNIPPAQMWQSSISPEDILLPADPKQLDAILGRSDTRRLTHKGIELDGLFYNSTEMRDLRRRHGDVLDVEIRIDDADIGSIVVLSPDQGQMHVVPALDQEYAKGLSRWQHKVIKRFAANTAKQSDNIGWRQAKSEIAEMIEAEFGRMKISGRKKVARYISDDRISATTDAPAKSHAPARASEPKSDTQLILDVQDGVPAADESPTPVPPAAPRSDISPTPGRKVFKRTFRNRKSDQEADVDE